MPEKLRGLTDGYVKVGDKMNGGHLKRKKKFKFYQRKISNYVCTKWMFIVVLLLIWLVWLIWYLSVRSKPHPQSYGELVLIPTELANEKGAYCLDGTPPGYYFRKGHGDGENSWIVYLQGGGWCWNVSDCYARSNTELGSSAYFNLTYPFEGFLSSCAKSNPDFHNWNVAYLAYCDGASFAGNQPVPTKYDGNEIFFRGKRVLDLLLDYLMDQGLRSADRVILSGVSAGGLAVYIHADYIRSKFPPQTAFHAFPDAGYFPNIRNATNFEHIKISFQRVYNLQRVQDSLNAACLADQDRNSKWKCFFPQYTYPYITTPIFVLNSAYDYWSLWFIMNVRCYISDCDAKGIFYYKHFHDQAFEITQLIYKSSKDGIYVTSCYAHSQAVFDHEWTGYVVNGTTPAAAFGDWYFGRKTVQQSKYWDCATPACNPTCDWSLEYYKSVTGRLGRFDFFI
uniref:Uncharacterized protein LOC100372731 n=1 Tax=Saccoglossus kowalevskii TaxID=10224 RepID=A0ABM0GSJ3_SACKO|nr:PREDICTED: uncharacterized protein LOC100372731 [Saccoglossus kowalevskii]